MADKEYATIDKDDRVSLGITKTNFRNEFSTELRAIRKKKGNKL